MSLLDQQFWKATLADQDWIRQALRYSGRDSAEFTFGNIFMWSPSYHVSVGKIDGMLVIRSQHSYTIPAGDGDAGPVLQKMLDEAEEPLQLHGLDDIQKDWLEQTFPGVFTIRDNRNNANYIYEVKDLAELPGKKYHGKRNHCSYFEKTYQWSYEAVTKENLAEAKAFVDRWMEESPERTEEEQIALELAFQNFFELGFTGGILRVDGNVIAFTAGEPINDQVYCTHIEKADSAYRGAYPMINREFARHALSSYKYVNREEDMGIPGLRKAKESYHPVSLYASYLAVQKSNIDYQPKLAEESDQEDLQALWQEVFGDDPQFIQDFFRYCCKPENRFVIKDDKKVISMAYLIPCTYCSKGQEYKAYYFYAAATHPDNRGRGYMASLIQYVKQVATERGIDLIFLVPAETGLFTYYENLGFQPALYHKTLQFTAQELQEAFLSETGSALNEDSVETALPDRLQQREQALQGTDHLSYTKEQLQYFFYTQLVSGGHVAVAKDGYAFYEKKDNTVMVTEWISTDTKTNLPATLLAENADCYQFRLPISASVFPGKEASPEADGMACAMTELGAQALQEKEYPYIGFPLS